MYQIHPIAAFSDNYIWCLYDPESSAALIVDPGDAAPVVAFLQQQGLTLEAILLTHHHPDHSNGIRTLQSLGEVPVFGPDRSPYRGVTHPLEEGDQVQWRDFSFQVLNVPGHTLDHIAFYSTEQATDAPLLFSGDALFISGCGRLFEGQPAQMRQSLEKFLSLADDTLVCCGHEYTLANLAFARAVLPQDSKLEAFQQHCQQLRDQGHPTVPGILGQEKQLNPFLRWQEPDVMTAADNYAQQAGLPPCQGQPDQVFAAIRHWKDHF
ncbi:MAG: hydroxyacylglutathione hydrolase [Halomonadaceae bacterium]|nr:MAG: hydroxyacylglutathione hydrolase [Halomonadaceae bacterium]